MPSCEARKLKKVTSVEGRFNPAAHIVRGTTGYDKFKRVAFLQFQVNGKPFDPNRVDRVLMLGGVDEWTLKSDFISHPFHIHVNPFQVVKIRDPSGKDVSVPDAIDNADGMVDPQYRALKGVWKDTILVKNFAKPNDPSGQYTVVVRTRSEKVDKIRKVLVEELMAHAPDAPELVKLAEEYGADRNRFEKEASFCVLCGLCVRYCDEVKKKNAVSFFDNGSVRQISFVPEVAKNECWDCQECFAICPTSYAQAAYLLTEALAFPGQRKTAARAAKAAAKPRMIIPIMAVPMTA